MRRSIAVKLGFCVLMLASIVGAARAQTTPRPGPGEEPSRQQLIAELNGLKLEVLRQGIEFQEWKTRQLVRELQQARGEQERLAEEERALQQELAELDRQAGSAAPQGGEGVGELVAVKEELTGKRMPRLRAKQQPLEQRVAELAEQLNRDEARLRELSVKAAKLQSGR